MALDLSGAVTAPPRTAKAAQASSRRLSSKLAERKEAVDGVFQLAGFGCIVLRQYADAGAIGMHAGPIAEELVALSDKNEKIAKALDYLTEAGPYAGLVIAVMPLALQLAANHGIIKAEFLGNTGVVAPDALTAQVRADMARQAAMAVEAQRQAEAELADLMAKVPEDGSPAVPEANGKPPSRASHRGKVDA